MKPNERKGQAKKGKNGRGRKLRVDKSKSVGAFERERSERTEWEERKGIKKEKTGKEK